MGPVTEDEVSEGDTRVVELLAAAVDEGVLRLDEVVDDDVVVVVADIEVAVSADEMQLHTAFAEADAWRAVKAEQLVTAHPRARDSMAED